MDIKVFFAVLSLLFQGMAPVTPQAPVIRTVVNKSSNYAQAIKANRELIGKLRWDFAGTRQHGLTLYQSIALEMVGCKVNNIASPEFVSALAGWQQQQQLPATGILDEDSWERMVAILQTNRLKNREYPPMTELVTVERELYFDPTRPDELRKVHAKAFAAYQRMLAAARADKTVAACLSDAGNPEAGKYFKIISSWRSREYQEQLRKQQGGGLGRIALAKNSPHFTGRALDIYVGGLPVSTEDNNRAKQVATPIYQWLVRNAARFGFRPYFFEPWHWEYVGDEEENLLVDANKE